MRASRTEIEPLLRRVWEAGTPAPAGVSTALSVASAGYRGALGLRDRLYGWGVFRAGRLPRPVISIGNLTLGGSGKTPAVELAVRTLLTMGAMPGVVSRGYGRRTRGVQVVADRDGLRLGPRDAGDEPVLLAEHLRGTPVVVGESRYEAGRVALGALGADIVVLDDGYQHRTVDKDLEILVVNGRAPWGNGRLFPSGRLREPLPAIGRADLVVITNPATAADLHEVSETVRRYNDRAPVIGARYEVIGLREVTGDQRAAAGGVAGRRLLAFAGLGSPATFVETVASTGARVTGFVAFPDHHWYSPGDLAGLAERSLATGSNGLCTTEKDWMRLRDLPRPPVPLWLVSVTLSLDSGRAAWDQALLRTWTRPETEK